MNDFQLSRLARAQAFTAMSLKAGVHPRQIREGLATRNLPAFKYSAVRHQGKRETARRKAQGNLCEANCGNKAQGTGTLCDACLAAKWGGQ